jgi:hypothetical protein
MAKAINTGAFAPQVEGPSPAAGTPAGLTPEMLQQLSAMDPAALMAQIQAMQQGSGVAPIDNPLDDLQRGNVAPSTANPVMNPFDDYAGLAQPANAPVAPTPNLDVVQDGASLVTESGRMGTTPEVQAAQREQFDSEEAARSKGAVGFKQRTQEEFKESYKDYMLPGKIGTLYRTARHIGASGIKGNYKIKDPENILPKSATPVQLVSESFKTSPVEAVNATTFAFIKLSRAMSAKQASIDNGFDTPEDGVVSDQEIESLFGFESGEVHLDEDNRVIIDGDTLDGIFAGYTKSSFARVRGADIGALDQPRLVGNAQLQMLKNSGLVDEVFYQPKDPNGEVIDPEGHPKRGYQISKQGATVSMDLRELANENKREYSEETQSLSPESQNKSINQPMARRKAVKIHGPRSGKSIGAYNVRKIKQDVYAGEKADKNTASYEYVEAYRESPVRMNPRVLGSIDSMIQVFQQGSQVEKDGGQVPPEQKRLMDNISKMLKLEAVPTDAPGSPSKLIKAYRDLAGAKGVQGFVKRHVNPHGQSHRLTNDTADVNEQESPRIHKGAMEGRPQNYVFTDLKNKSDSEPVISEAEWSAFQRFVKGTGQPSLGVQRTAMLWSLGSWIVPGTRINSDQYLVNNFTMGTLREFAKKGALMEQFIADPSIVKDPAVATALNEFIESDVGIDKGKVNGFITKSSLLAKDIVTALDSASTGDPIGLAFSPVAASMDQSSAGRTFMAFDQGDWDTVTHVGLLYNPDSTNMFPSGNPRAFFLETLQASLKNDGKIPGLDTLQQQAVLSIFTPEGGTAEAYAEFADDLAKGALMVNAYGKSHFFMHAQAEKFLSTRPEIKAALDALAEETESFNSGLDIANEVIGHGLQTVNKDGSWYTQGLKSQAIAAALLGFNLSGELSDGSSVRIGMKEYAVLPESGYEFIGPDGEQTSVGQLSSRTPTDAPTARAKRKYDSDSKMTPIKRLGSAQVNSVGPAMGHLREVEVNAIAHRAVQKRLQDPNVYFGNIHDNVMGDPLYMAMMQHEIKAAMKQITSHDMGETIYENYEANLRKAVKRINSMEEEVVIGSASKDPVLSSWLEYLDEMYSEFESNVLKGVEPKFAWMQEQTSNTLRRAYNLGIWRPLAKPGLTQYIGATPLDTRQPSETVAMVVPRNNLLKFIKLHLIDTVSKHRKTKSDRVFKRDALFNATFDFLENNEQGWMKIGR